MPLLHCAKCHHEWEGAVGSRCQWCAGIGYVLEEKTPIEKSLDDLFDATKNIEKFLKKMEE